MGIKLLTWKTLMNVSKLAAKAVLNMGGPISLGVMSERSALATKISLITTTVQRLL